MRCRICGQEVVAPGYCMICGTYYDGGNNQAAVFEGQVENVNLVAMVSAGEEQTNDPSDYSLVPYASQQAGSDYQGDAVGNGMYGYTPQGDYYPQQNGYGYINHSKRKRNVIIFVITSVMLLSMVILTVALSGSAGASSPEDAISNYIQACTTGDADALLNAMLPLDLQKKLTEKQKKNLKEEMEFCNAEIRDLETSYSSSVSEEKIEGYKETLIESLEIYDSEFEIDRIIRYTAHFEVMGEIYIPSIFQFEGKIKNFSKWESTSYSLYCYKAGGKWYCITLF